MSDISPVKFSFLPAFLKVGGAADGPPSSWKTTLFGVGLVAGIFFAVRWLTKPPPSLPKVDPKPEGSSKEKTEKVVEDKTHHKKRSSSPPPLNIKMVEQVDTSDNEESRSPRSPSEVKKKQESSDSDYASPKGSPKSPRSPRSPYSPGGVSYDSTTIGWGAMQSHESPAGKKSKKNLFSNNGEDSPV